MSASWLGFCVLFRPVGPAVPAAGERAALTVVAEDQAEARCERDRGERGEGGNGDWAEPARAQSLGRAALCRLFLAGRGWPLGVAARLSRRALSGRFRWWRC